MIEASTCPRVVFVDDDVDLRSLIGDFLSRNRIDVVTAASASELCAELRAAPADLILLDVMMPGESGLSVLRRMTGKARPGIIMLSAMGDESDRIEGLELGADDYIAKPCNPRELLARIRAVLRRRQEAREIEPPRTRRFGQWTVDLITRQLRSGGGPGVQLTDGEFRVLTALLDVPETVLSRDQLLDAARGEGVDIFDRAIDVTVSRLRRKLGAGNPIRTVRSEGYMLTLAGDRA